MSAPRDTADPRQQDSRLGLLSPSELLGHVLATMPSGLFTVSATGHITSWNRAMEELTGYRAHEVIGEPCTILQGDTCFLGRPQADGTFGGCLLFQEEEVCGRRCTLKRRDGSTLPVLKNARIIRDEAGRLLGGIEVITDITGVLNLEQEVAELRNEVSARARYRRLVGRHPVMQQLYDRIEHASRTASSVLVQGETGVGKELVAHAIHHSSDRRDRPFVRVACGALSESLLESELFGHVRGAFTGAVSGRKGRFEAAHGGTILLDEIGDISPNVQQKLLRVLQEREFERVGDNQSVKVDIRVIAATNRDLLRLCDEGRFRRDLYYRLAVIPITVPPLRERASDIPLLVEFFLERLNRSLGRAVVGVSPAAMERLTRHDWPGNVRELEHAIEFAMAVTTGKRLEEESLPPAILGEPARRGGAPAGRRGGASRPDRAAVEAALARCGGNRTRAAAELGVSRVTLWKWLKRLGIDGGA